MRFVAMAAAVVLSVLSVGTSVLYAGWDEGVAAFTNKNYQRAVVEFQNVVKRNPKNWEAYLYLGRAYSELGEYSRAKRSLRNAERRIKGVKPAEKKRVWKQLGFVYEKQKKYGKAREAYLKAGETGDAARVERMTDTRRMKSR